MFSFSKYIIKINYRIIIIFLAIIILSACSKKNYQKYTPKYPVIFNNYWAIIKDEEKNYISSFPIHSNTNTKNRNLHYLMVVNDQKEQSIIVSLVGGKNYNKLSEVIVKINFNEYYIPVSKDRAWLINKELVGSLIEDMLNSNTLTIVNYFEDNTQAVDTYSLKGFKEALEMITQA